MQLPTAFIQATQEILGNEYPSFEASLREESPVSIRLNRNKNGISSGSEKVVWCDTGYYLKERPLFTADPLFHAGCYYVQEASSMFLEQVIRQIVRSPITALDLCAAPGGKSTHLSALLPAGSLLVSNEIIRSRAHILAENLCKWGNPARIVLQSTPEAIGRANRLFDLIVTDVPCSGEGMFRKDPASIDEWSPENVKLCVERQRNILRDIWPALKPGGFIVYSTCTYNTLENEDNIAWIAEELGAQAVSLSIPEEWNISPNVKGSLPSYRFFPHRTQGEGFFMAVLQKEEEEESASRSSGKVKKGKERTKQSVAPAPGSVKDWLSDSSSFHFFTKENEVYAIPALHKEILNTLEQSLHPLHPGIHLCSIKGKDLIPSQQLALSTALHKGAFPSYEIDKATALQYLSKEAITSLPADLPKGYLLLTYQKQALGFVKNIGNRANNLYPQEWRIRMKLH